jgi:hypothetical protein
MVKFEQERLKKVKVNNYYGTEGVLRIGFVYYRINHTIHSRYFMVNQVFSLVTLCIPALESEI